MSVASQVFVGTVAGAVMAVRVAVAIHRARVDGRIAARRARDELEWRAIMNSRTR